MIETYQIRAYWGDQRMSAVECAEHIAKLLSCLADCDPLLSQWFEKGASHKAALKSQVESNPQQIEKLLLTGQSHNDLDNEVIRKLGFSLGLWNGNKNDDNSVSLSIRCGSSASVPTSRNSNSCILQFPNGNASKYRLTNTAVVGCIISAIVTVWKPNYAALYSASYENIVDGIKELKLAYYLPIAASELPSLPSPTKIIEQSPTDLLILVAEEGLSASNSIVVEAANKVAAILQKHVYY